MKNIFFGFLFLCSSYAFSFCVFITDITPSSLNEGINVNLEVLTGCGAGYLSNSYTITGNVIDLTFCYWFNNTLPVLEFEQDFFIPLESEGEYTLNVHIMLSNSQETCDNFEINDEETITLNYLNADSFVISKSAFSVYPNPTSDYVTLKGDLSEITKVCFYDSTGRMVKSIEAFFNEKIPLMELEKGIYIIEFHTKNSIKKQKLILN